MICHTKATASEKAILEAFAGHPLGKSTDEACKAKGAPSKSLIEHNKRSLVERGLLVPMTPEGRKPILYKPKWEVVEDPPESAAETPAPSPLGQDRYCRAVISRAKELVEHIDGLKGRMGMKAARRMCEVEIAPFIESLRFLKESGYPIRMPGEHSPFFDSKNRKFWIGIGGSGHIPGTIAVFDSDAKVSLPNEDSDKINPREICAIGTLKNGTPVVAPVRKLSKVEMMENGMYIFFLPDGRLVETQRESGPWASPSLVEWGDYLRTIIDQLDKC